MMILPTEESQKYADIVSVSKDLTFLRFVTSDKGLSKIVLLL